jgi:hypothetical protein
MLQTKKRFWGSKPGFDMGDVLHIGVNVIFVIVIFASVELWQLVPLAVILILLSKWRIFAVQPRFWLPNVRANLVDIIVGVSTIAIADQTDSKIFSAAWFALYLLWLLLLKPQTGELWVGLQAFLAQFMGIAAVFMIDGLVRQPALVCALVWLIAWAAARHYFSNYEEPHYRSLGLIWGFIATQFAWITLHWAQYYTILGVKVVILAVIISIMSASIGSIYHAYKKQNLHRGILLENGLFAAALIVVILATSRWTAGL